MNTALNQTLSRTLITSGTVFLSTMALYIFGGGVINDFAFAFLIGILTGTWFASFLAGHVLVVFEAIFDALAAGTFFYIAVMDILSEEFHDSSGRWSRFAMAIAGFAVMAVVAVWA